MIATWYLIFAFSSGVGAVPMDSATACAKAIKDLGTFVSPKCVNTKTGEVLK